MALRSQEFEQSDQWRETSPVPLDPNYVKSVVPTEIAEDRNKVNAYLNLAEVKKALESAERSILSPGEIDSKAIQAVHRAAYKLLLK